MNTCSFEGCGRKQYGKGLCQGHHKQQYDGKELQTLRQDITVENRFMKHVEKTDTCWLYNGAVSTGGYGNFRDGTMKLAHRYAYELFVGPVNATDVIHHTCHVRNCVNPAHLQAVTQQQNTAETLDRQHLLARIAELEAKNLELKLALESALLRRQLGQSEYSGPFAGSFPLA